MDLAKVFERRNLEIDFGDQTLHLAYLPQTITPQWYQRLVQSAESAVLMPTALAELIATWDLTDGERGLVPVTVEALTALPCAFLTRLFTAILADVMPPEPPKQWESTQA